MIVSKYTHIVLDMDGTLLEGYYDDYNNTIIKARPYLTQFFKFLFDNYECVSIWTNGGLEWYNKCYKETLMHHIPSDRCLDFVITFDDNLVLCRSSSPKRLQCVYNLYPTYNKENTLMIDDSEHVFKCNVDNGLLISTYSCPIDDDEDEDEALLHIMGC